MDLAQRLVNLLKLVMSNTNSERQVFDGKKRFVGRKAQINDFGGVEYTPPYLEGWVQIAGSKTPTYSAADTVDFGSDISKTFSLGDYVRWKQTGDTSWRYGYVYGVNGQELEITGGSDYTLENKGIIEFWKGVSPAPTGHPILLNFDAQLYAVSPGSTYSNLDAENFEVTQFFMIGPLVLVRMDVSNSSMAGGASPIYGTPPIPSNFLTYERRIISCVDNFSFATGLTKMGGSNIIEIYANPVTLAGFANTTNGLGFNISLEYPVG